MGARPAATAPSARTAASAPTGSTDDGDAPGCAAAIRTSRAPGRLRNTTGGSRTAASPSIPAGAGPSEATQNGAGVTGRHGSPPPGPPDVVPGGSPPVTPSSPSSSAGRVPAPAAPPSRYWSLLTRMTAAPDFCRPPGVLQRRAGLLLPELTTCGTVATKVRSFAPR